MKLGSQALSLLNNIDFTNQNNEYIEKEVILIKHYKFKVFFLK